MVCGAGGFLGVHLVRRLRQEGYWVRGIDLCEPEFSRCECDEFHRGDLRELSTCLGALSGPVDEVYQLAAETGGAGYAFSGENDFSILSHSAKINLNIARACTMRRAIRVFYSSSAHVYPAQYHQEPEGPSCAEHLAYTAEPSSEYGWENLFSERVFLAAARNEGLSVRIARIHNVFGPECVFYGGREKVIAAICRKIAMVQHTGEIEVWGNGAQTRSFLTVGECVEGIRRLMKSDFTGPVNLGAENRISINRLVQIIARVAQKDITVRHCLGSRGVPGYRPDNSLLYQKLNWKPRETEDYDFHETYIWIESQLRARGFISF